MLREKEISFDKISFEQNILSLLLYKKKRDQIVMKQVQSFSYLKKTNYI